MCVILPMTQSGQRKKSNLNLIESLDLTSICSWSGIYGTGTSEKPHTMCCCFLWPHADGLKLATGNGTYYKLGISVPESWLSVTDQHSPDCCDSVGWRHSATWKVTGFIPVGVHTGSVLVRDMRVGPWSGTCGFSPVQGICQGTWGFGPGQGHAGWVLFKEKSCSRYMRVHPGQGTYKKQPTDISLFHQCISSSLSLSLPLALKINK